MATIQTVQPGPASPGRTVINANFAAINAEMALKETAIGAHVRSRFQRIIHNNFNAAQLASGEYAKLRQRLYADFKEKALL